MGFFKEIECSTASAQAINRFDALVMPILAMIEANYEEANTLAETRDALLTSLGSGEIRVPHP